MENQNFCQSCSMPLDDLSLLGTEKDGTMSKEYCKYCYQNGSLVNPDMSLNEMRTMVKMQMEKMHMPSEIIEKAVNILPSLKRWKDAE